MHTFKDSLARDWSLEINVAAVKKIKASELKLDLLSAIDGKLILDLAEDPCTLCDLLFLLVEKQAADKNISAEDFGRGLAGDAIEKATLAFLEELVDFFPSGKRNVLAKMLARATAYQQMAADRALKILESPETTKALDDRLDTAAKQAMEMVNSPLVPRPSPLTSGASSTRPPAWSD